jgi:hypothetical protein
MKKRTTYVLELTVGGKVQAESMLLVGRKIAKVARRAMDHWRSRRLEWLIFGLMRVDSLHC